MRKFWYIFDWVLVILASATLLFSVIYFSINGWGATSAKLIWVPFVLAWGINNIRKYKEANNAGR